VETSLLDSEELLALARLDFEKERFDQALVRLKQAAAGDGSQPAEISALLGATYARLRLWGRAREAFEAFLARHPDALNERFQLGMTYFDGGELDRALSTWQEVLRREPLHPPALYYSALSCARLGKLEPAMSFCETVVSSSAKDNLFHGRSRELAEQLRADLQKRSAAAVPPSRTSH